jgi:DNA replication protein DnaC
MKNPELELAYKYVQLTNENIFLTGKAGTGKTTFLKSLKQKLNKRSVVVAPTGVAAINAGGVTIHSFFQLPFGPIITERVAGHRIDNPNFKQKFNRQKIKIIKTLDLLIIDEISMVRADMLDAVDEVLRRYKNPYQPFGGTQLLMIGDMQQLAPVVKREEYSYLEPYYKSMFFFNSHALRETKPVTVELKHIYRQQDNTFIEVLNEVRDNKLSRASYDILHSRFQPDFKPDEKDGYITLCTHNRTANAINSEKLSLLKTKSKSFEAEVNGKFPEHAYPTDYDLKLKVGAQVMFVKNDSAREKRYFNGKIGIITGFEEERIQVKCEGEQDAIECLPETWENIRYTINPNTKEIEEEFIGSFTQYPLRLAWAVTIHKSQGLTFERAVIDAADAFAHGQTYVALSRCKNLQGMVLSSKISESAIICDEEVVDFNRKNRENEPSPEDLKNSIYQYQKALITELFNYRQLQYRLNALEKQLKESTTSISGTLGQKVNDINKSALPEITKTAGSFLKQVNKILKNNPDAENNSELKERLEKAGAYFIKFHREKIIESIESSTFETDNQAVKKATEDGLNSLYEILHVKQKCLKVCAEGFSINEYVNTRAKAMLEKPEKKKTAARPKEIETKYPELYAKLKVWRLEQSETEDVPLFQILPNHSLAEITENLPVSSAQLKKIKGIGKKKLALYGEALLNMVETFCSENHIEPDRSEPKIKQKSQKSNAEKSFEMYKSGKSIEEIAKTQEFVISTIENHLAKYVESGELEVKEFVSDEKLKKITDYFLQNPESGLREAKDALDESVSWSDLRFVQKHLAHLEKKTAGNE